ncbi:ABC transporter permease [Variovorax sp. dw_308]|uniref:ABC transporter permease n=1 Tax=Variovorax sp. dw_308 TaxID=2721546 RepID=UPI001C46EAEA|nr:ABC transporter permease [Variovorax sp. dw_308]
MNRFRMPAAHAVFLAVFLGAWEYASRAGWLAPTSFGRPSAIFLFLWDGLFVSRSLLVDLGWTLGATFLAFIAGSLLAVLAGLLFINFPAIEKFCEPYLSAINAMPRIALAPLFILWFGLGIGSKIAVGVSLTFFIVLSSTIAGMRAVSADWLTLSRTLGARPGQLFFKVTLPSATPVMFSGLRLGLVYSLLGVVGAEILASEHGLGQQVAYLTSTFDMSGVMGLLLLLALVGSLVTWSMNRLEVRLLAWQ